MMDGTNAPCCPCRPLSTENGALTADIATFEQRLLTVDRSDDVQYADRFGRTREPEAASRTLGSNDQAGFLQLREQFGDILDRYALYLGKRTNARRLALVERVDKKEQAMQPILHAGSNMCHSRLPFCFNSARRLMVG
jgi:hypothetical protein